MLFVNGKDRPIYKCRIFPPGHFPSRTFPPNPNHKPNINCNPNTNPTDLNPTDPILTITLLMPFLNSNPNRAA